MAAVACSAAMASAADVTSAAAVTSAADVASAADVTAPITHLVPVEVIEGPVSTERMRTAVAVTRIEAIINVADEVCGAVVPRAGTDERAVVEPFGPVVSVWGACVGAGVVVAVRAIRFYSDGALGEGALGGYGARNAQQSERQGKNDKLFPIAHKFLIAE
jgi:hypothetical protein